MRPMAATYRWFTTTDVNHDYTSCTNGVRILVVGRMLTRAEVAVHNTRSSCWVVIQGKAYDVTSFIDSHPGGGAAILNYAGKVGSRMHDRDTVDNF